MHATLHLIERALRLAAREAVVVGEVTDDLPRLFRSELHLVEADHALERELPALGGLAHVRDAAQAPVFLRLVAGRALLVKEGLGDRDPLSVFVFVSLFALLALSPILVIPAVFATATPAPAALAATLASIMPRALATFRILRVLELLAQGVIHERGIVALHPEVALFKPAPVCGDLQSGLTR